MRRVGRVVLAATPLGNPRDASPRLGEALSSTPVIAAEDTRRVRRLCADLGVTPSGRIVSYFDANETSRVPALLDSLRDGEDVLVVTDAGMPSVSDPGYRLVAAAGGAGPGASRGRIPGRGGRRGARSRGGRGGRERKPPPGGRSPRAPGNGRSSTGWPPQSAKSVVPAGDDPVRDWMSEVRT